MLFTLLVLIALMFTAMPLSGMKREEAAQSLLELRNQNTPKQSKKKLLQMPDEKMLKHRLGEYSFLLDQSTLRSRIAGKQLTAQDIAQEFHESCTEYLSYIKQKGWSEIAIEGQKLYTKQALPLLFLDYPIELRVLTVLGYYTPKE